MEEKKWYNVLRLFLYAQVYSDQYLACDYTCGSCLSARSLSCKSGDSNRILSNSKCLCVAYYDVGVQ